MNGLKIKQNKKILNMCSKWTIANPSLLSWPFYAFHLQKKFQNKLLAELSLSLETFLFLMCFLDIFFFMLSGYYIRLFSDLFFFILK